MHVTSTILIGGTGFLITVVAPFALRKKIEDFFWTSKPFNTLLKAKDDILEEKVTFNKKENTLREINDSKGKITTKLVVSTFLIELGEEHIRGYKRTALLNMVLYFIIYFSITFYNFQNAEANTDLLQHVISSISLFIENFLAYFIVVPLGFIISHSFFALRWYYLIEILHKQKFVEVYDKDRFNGYFNKTGLTKFNND